MAVQARKDESEEEESAAETSDDEAEVAEEITYSDSADEVPSDVESGSEEEGGRAGLIAVCVDVSLLLTRSQAS